MRWSKPIRRLELEESVKGVGERKVMTEAQKTGERERRGKVVNR